MRISAKAVGFSAAFLLALNLTGTSKASETRETSTFFSRSNVIDLGKLPGNTPMTLSFMLKFNHDAELSKLVDEQKTVGSPLYQHFLTQQQFNAYFAPTVSTYSYFVSRLRASGFTIDSSNPLNHVAVRASATANVVNAFLGTEEHAVRFNGSVNYVNKFPEAMPKDLAPIVLATLGLQNLPLVRLPHVAGPIHMSIPAKSTVKSANVGPNLSGPVTGPNGAAGPAAIAEEFDLPANHQSPTGNYYQGGGHTLGIVGFTNYSPSDIVAYANYFAGGLTASVYDEAVDGGGTFKGSSDSSSIEADLDVETAVGLARTGAIHFADGSALTDQVEADDISRLVYTDNVEVISISAATCEGADPGFDTTINSQALAGNSQGITFVAATGDFGHDPCPVNQYVNTPSSNPNVLAIGGTTLLGFSNQAYQPQQAWGNIRDSRSPTGYQGSSGGCSPRWSKGSWQNGITPCSHRDLPDIALAGDPQGDFVIGGSWLVIGGTSWATPIFGAGLIEVNQQQNKRHGDIDARLYQIWNVYKYTSPNGIPMFHDITSGSCPGSSYSPPAQNLAGPNWDYCTGLGSPDIFGLGRIL